MKSKPNFFLTAAGENDALAVPRACWLKRRMRDPVSDQHMLVEIEPSLFGQSYGLGTHNIECLVISSRYSGISLFPIGQWPCHVYVARILDETITETLVFTHNQVEIIAWGRLYPTLDEATEDARKFGSLRV